MPWAVLVNMAVGLLAAATAVGIHHHRTRTARVEEASVPEETFSDRGWRRIKAQRARSPWDRMLLHRRQRGEVGAARHAVTEAARRIVAVGAWFPPVDHLRRGRQAERNSASEEAGLDRRLSKFLGMLRTEPEERARQRGSTNSVGHTVGTRAQNCPPRGPWLDVVVRVTG
jgi:hypothetical protein